MKTMLRLCQREPLFTIDAKLLLHYSLVTSIPQFVKALSIDFRTLVDGITWRHNGNKCILIKR
jgi:hypothetical protein